MRTKLDMILNQVKCGKREVTFDLADYTKAQAARVRAVAKARGLHVSGTSRWVLVRDLYSRNGGPRPTLNDGSRSK